MKRLLALLLTLALIIGACSVLTACKPDTGNDPSGVVTPTPDPTPNPGDGENDGPTVITPEFKDYGRGTVNFDELTYERPDIAAVIAAFEAVNAQIRANEKTVDELIELIDELNEPYEQVYTMYTISEINNSRDSSVAFWADEYEYISTNLSAFSQAIEDMYVAAAQSPNKTEFEEKYFLESLDEYVDGGVYTDALVELLADEAELIAEYNAFSTATVEITLKDGTKGTVDALMESVPENKKQATLALYMQYYQDEVTRLSTDIYVELVKVRMLIADEMGKDSYLEVAYEDLGHEYTPEQMVAFLKSIKGTVAISSDLYMNNFYHLYNEIEPSANPVDVINELYALYGEVDTEIADIYAYMLQHGLYDVAPAGGNRLEAAYTTYIYSNASPFIFMTATEKYSDYVTLSHEFGHFVDNYINYGNQASLDLSEVYSTAWSYLTLLELEDEMCTTTAGEKAYRYMLHNEMSMISDTLMYQGYLAAFEHLVFGLEYDEVSKESIEALMDDAQRMTWGYEIEELAAWDAVLMVHTVEYPCYVQSYCTSLVAAVEIMLMEIEEEGAGLAAFKTLVDREGFEDLTFEEQLERAGIASPLRTLSTVEMIKGVYRYITGKDYGSGTNKLPDAA